MDNTPQTSSSQTPSERPSVRANANAQKKALRILAKSVFKELQSAGYDRAAMVGFTSELLDVVTSEMWSDSE